jgi:hypothetical protein
MRTRTTSFRWYPTCFLAIAALSMVGCLGFKMDDPPGNGQPAEGASVNGPAWQIRPTSMRIYPATRFVTSEDDAVLEARVQFYDEAEDTTKAVGHMRIELFELRRAEAIVPGRRLHTWEVPLLTLEANKTHYDPITRAYIFRLRVAGAELAEQNLLVKATFMPVSGQRMEAQRPIGRTRPTIEAP